MTAVVYDIETYPNVFTLCAEDLETDQQWRFEISPRRNDMPALIAWLMYLAQNKIEMIGFNNVGFDYVVIHAIMKANGNITIDQIYQVAKGIIDSDDRFGNVIWPNERFIPQIDLFKIHHFDNMARSTSLKALQFNMRSDSVEDLPLPPGVPVPLDRIDDLLSYNMHDVTETKKFAKHSAKEIEFRRVMSAKHDRDFMNHNDTKIGKDFFVMELEKIDPNACFEKVNGRRQPRQTKRPSINLNDVVFPYIKFDHPEFKRILDWFRAQTITETKGVFKDVSCSVNGFEFDFGTGGIHGSLTNQIVRADEVHSIIDLDVRGYYPAIAIVNGLYPEHLGVTFCRINADVVGQRANHPKGTSENAILKLASNGVYGDSNNQYSPFYDPQYTMSITINGQLLLCVLAEALMNIPGLSMIQVNTDGLTVKVPRAFEWMVEQVRRDWEKFTCLELEEARYSAMFLRDVNNYIAVYEGGDVKLKGAYDHDKAWHQDQSALIVPKTAEAALVHGESIEQFIQFATDPFDFMLRAKVPRKSSLVMAHGPEHEGDVPSETPMQNTTRYYVSNAGGSLVKISPPPAGCIQGAYKRRNGVSERDYRAIVATLPDGTWDERVHTKNKSRYETRRMGFNVGWKTTECNRASAFDWSNLNREFYIQETEKLVGILK